jgi:hypothetical protein
MVWLQPNHKSLVITAICQDPDVPNTQNFICSDPLLGGVDVFTTCTGSSWYKCNPGGLHCQEVVYNEFDEAKPACHCIIGYTLHIGSWTTKTKFHSGKRSHPFS